MKIIIISQLFDPENTIKGLNFAKELHKNGHEIEVITGFPNYPTGKIYAGYKQSLFDISAIDGIIINRLPSYISHSRSSTARTLSYLSFGVSALIYCLCTWRRKRPDIIYAYYPPVVAGIISLVLSRLFRTPFIYDVQDLWPDALSSVSILKENRFLYKFIQKACDIIYKRASHIIVLSEGYKNFLINQGIEENKISVVYNWCDERRLSNCNARNLTNELFDEKFFNVLYAGNIGPAQALDYVIDAARILKSEKNNSIRFYFLGAGIEKEMLRERAAHLNLENIFFLDRVPPENVQVYLNAASALLIHLKSSKVMNLTIPQKTQAYLFARKPILIAADGEASEIIEMSGGGLSCKACNSDALVKTVKIMSEMDRSKLDEMALKGEKFYWERMSFYRGLRQIEQIMQNSISERG